jgi:hypothetical protein
LALKNEQYLSPANVFIVEADEHMKDFLHIAESGANPEGHCIRCNMVITYNPDNPFCAACQEVWNQLKNPDHEEDYCHDCGNMNYTSKNQPACYPCYTENKYAQDLIARTG